MQATFDPFGNADLDSLAEVFERALPKVDITIPDELVERYITVVRCTGIGHDLEQWEAEEQESLGGRPKPFSADTALVGLLLAAEVHNRVLDTTVHDVLYSQITDEMRTKLGIRTGDIGQHGGKPDYYRRLNHRFNSLIQGIDPSPWIKNRLVLKTEVESLRKDMTPEEMALKAQRLDSVVHRLLYASFMMMPRALRRKWKGGIAIDGTGVPQFTRGIRKRSKWASCDLDCGWYARAADEPAAEKLPTAKVGAGSDRVEDPKGRLPNYKRLFYGMEATLGIMASDNIYGRYSHPNLILAMVMDLPGFRIGENGTRVATQIFRRTGQVGWLAGDRCYSNSMPEKFQLPTRALGYHHIFDYRKDQLGRQENYGHAIQVEGHWYCDCMPESLIEATRAYRKRADEEGKIDRASWQARLLRRRDHLMKVHEARLDGSIRFVSPCCPKKPSITIPVEVGAKFHQELEFGLLEHRTRYAIMRNTNEGTNGTAKDGATVGLEQPTRRRKRGVAAQSLLCAALLFAENLRRIESFLKKASEDDKGELVFKRKGRPRRKGLEDYMPGDGRPAEPEPDPEADPYGPHDDDPPEG